MIPLKPIIFICLIGLLQTTGQAADQKAIIGWVEPVMIIPHNIRLLAKIDTGADHSSIDAIDPQTFNRNGEDWIGFRVIDEQGNEHRIERPILRHTRVKRRGVEAQKRVVIRLGVCLDQRLRHMDVSLTNRTDYNYKMLIGRSFLEGLFIVDSDMMNATTPGCKQKNGG